eukprot:7996469-Alexandrium_andersonii.AAC.1
MEGGSSGLLEQEASGGGQLPTQAAQAAQLPHLVLRGAHPADARSASTSSSSSAPSQPHPAKTLCLPIDQGSDGLAPAFFCLTHLLLRAVVFFDPHHRAWNDCRNALADSGLWGATLMWGICFSLFYGPWDTGQGWRSTQEAAGEYSAS